MRRLKTIFLTWTIFIIACFVSFTIFFVNPIVAMAAKAKVEALTTKAVNRAVSNVVTAGTYRELTNIRYDERGKITSISANMLQMNGLSSDIANSSQYFLEMFAANGIAVPMGTFSGLPILTGRGPNINLRVVPVGSVRCTFDSAFIGQGINQTLHRVVLKVHSLVNLIMPLGSRNVSAEIEVLLCSSIIVGEVPEFFFAR